MERGPCWRQISHRTQEERALQEVTTPKVTNKLPYSNFPQKSHLKTVKSPLYESNKQEIRCALVSFSGAARWLFPRRLMTEWTAFFFLFQRDCSEKFLCSPKSIFLVDHQDVCKNLLAGFRELQTRSVMALPIVHVRFTVLDQGRACGTFSGLQNQEVNQKARKLAIPTGLKRHHCCIRSLVLLINQQNIYLAVLLSLFLRLQRCS